MVSEKIGRNKVREKEPGIAVCYQPRMLYRIKHSLGVSVLPATRQRFHSSLYTNHIKLVLELATPGDARLS